MSSILFSLPDLYASYKKWVSTNPQLASDFETTAKWVSYFIAGRINSSQVMSELVYSMSNLLVLFNDSIIKKTKELEYPSSGDNLKLWLTILDYSEVFLELSAKKVWGEAGRWLIIVVIQVFKCISRLLLVFKHKEQIIQNPPIPILQRKNVDSKQGNRSDDLYNHFESVSFTLQRSGKVLRKVEASPPVAVRNWKPIDVVKMRKENEQVPPQDGISRSQLMGETVYIIKPIVHLASVACFGSRTWKPWMISLLMDFSSLHLYNAHSIRSNLRLSPAQRLHVSRRIVGLFIYLLRSPFYDRYSKERILAALGLLSKKVPLASVICTPLMQYLPHWQSCYFYTWST